MKGKYYVVVDNNKGIGDVSQKFRTKEPAVKFARRYRRKTHSDDVVVVLFDPYAEQVGFYIVWRDGKSRRPEYWG